MLVIDPLGTIIIDVLNIFISAGLLSLTGAQPSLAGTPGKYNTVSTL